MSQKPWIVLKFGGTSVATADRWERIADRVRTLHAGHRVWVVVSALAGHTDRLEAAVQAALAGESPEIGFLLADCNRLAAETGVAASALDSVTPMIEAVERRLEGVRLTGEAPPRLVARILAEGERVSSRLGSVLLARHGVDATWVEADRVLTSESYEGETDEVRYLRARVPVRADPERGESAAGGAAIVITQGFLASTPELETCLLGRGGSDTSAALMAGLLEASSLEIWSDVPGIFTADPDSIPTAHLIRQIGYREAQELAALGGKVLHPRCLEAAERAGVSIELRSIEEPQVKGTRIETTREDHPVVTAVTCRRGVTLLTVSTLAMWGAPGYLARMFAPFETLGFSIDLLATSQSAVSLTLDAVPGGLDGRRFKNLVSRLEQMGRVEVNPECAVVSIVGRRIRAALPEIGSALEVFRERPVHMISDSSEDLNLSFVVSEADVEAVVERLHARLFTTPGADPRLGPTWEMLQGAVSLRPPAAPPWWRDSADTLRSLGQEEPSYVYHLPTVSERANHLIRSLPSVNRFYYAMKANAHPRILETVAAQGLGLECVSAAEVLRVREVLGDGCPVLFTPNFCPLKEYEVAFWAGAEVVVDGPSVLERAGSLFSGTEIGLRLDPGRGRGHHRKVRTAGTGTKFGQPLEAIEGLLETTERASARVVGLHAHVGSGVLDTMAWLETGTALASVLALFPGARWVDVGGGLGVPGVPGQPPLDLLQVEKGLASLRATLGAVSLRMEPGRYLVSEAGVLVAEVTQIREKEGVRFAGVGTGMNSLLRPALYGAWHTIHNLSRLEETPGSYWQIVGPICETGDVLGRDRWIPDPRPGDVLLIENAGAYGAVMSSRYNLREPAREVVFGEPGKTKP